jgi:nitronate monooxygenase
MSTHTPVCELLGIHHPIVSAPMAADARLPAAVSNAGALGTMGLWWVDDAGDLVREAAALTDRPFGGNFALTSDQHRRVDQALSAGLRIVSFILAIPRATSAWCMTPEGLLCIRSPAPRRPAARSDVAWT